MPRLASCRLPLHGVTGSPAGATRSRTLRSIATHTALRTADSILPLIRLSSHGSSGAGANLAMCRSKLAGDVARDPQLGSRYRGDEIGLTGFRPRPTCFVNTPHEWHRRRNLAGRTGCIP